MKTEAAIADLQAAAAQGFDTTDLQQLVTDFTRLGVLAAIVEAEAGLREIYLAHPLYAEDNSGMFPHYDAWLYQRNPAAPSSNWVEHGTIFPYLKDKNAYFCPADDRSRAVGSISIGAGGEYGEQAIHSYVRNQLVHKYYFRGNHRYDGIRNYLSPELILAGSWYPRVPREGFHPAADGRSVADRPAL